MPRVRSAIWVLAGAGPAWLAGCGTPAGAIFGPAEGAAVWPPPPDEARVRYVGALGGSDDLKPARGALQGLGEFLFGAEDPRRMVSPLGVCTDGHQRVFIADSNAQALLMLDLATREYAEWRPPEKEARFAQPVAVAFDPAGRVLVADSAAASVLAFDPQGKFLGELGRGALERPCGLAVEPGGGRIFVADSAAHQVVVLRPDGAEVGRLGTRGAGPGQFNFPTNVAFDREGRLLVSDTLNFRVQVFDRQLAPVLQFGRKGDMPGTFAQPKGLGVDADGHIYVVDANFEAVQVFDSQGTLMLTFGREGREPGEFWLPSGMWIDGASRIWIADSYNQRVQVFDYLPGGGEP